MEKTKTCCFFGHREISGEDRLRKSLYKIIEELIVLNEVETFLFGSKSDFNELCRDVVTELKQEYPHIKRIYVRAEFPYINDHYREYLLEFYEDTYFPERALNADRAVYVGRNCEIIDKSDTCIIYYNKDYLPINKEEKRYGDSI